jgi:glutamate--cysteine ligase
VKFAVALRLAPVVNALFANSPFYAGRRTEFVSFRAHVWHGMDPDRSGLLTELLAGEMTFARWVQHALDVPLLILADGDSVKPATGVTFRAFLNRGIDGRFPTRPDWALHLSTLFTEARLKRYLEVRGADATTSPIAVAAVWKGLLYDADALAAAADLARSLEPADLAPLARAAAHHGLRTRCCGRPLADWCREVVAIADAGLRRQHEDTAVLDPLRRVIASERAPGDDWATAGGVAEVIAACEYA